MLKEPSTDHIISWDPSGLKFFVNDRAQFSMFILPHYFAHSQFSSFTRQLRNFEFKRQGSRAGGKVYFGHPDFNKQDYNRALKIRSRYNKENCIKRPSSSAESSRIKRRKIDVTGQENQYIHMMPGPSDQNKKTNDFDLLQGHNGVDKTVGHVRAWKAATCKDGCAYPFPAHSGALNQGIPSTSSSMERHQLHQFLSEGAQDHTSLIQQLQDHTSLIQQLKKVYHGWNMLNEQNPTLAQPVVPTVPQSHGTLSSQWEPPFHLPRSQAPYPRIDSNAKPFERPLFYTSLSQDYWTCIPAKFRRGQADFGM
jgi:hypothetical protein